MRYLLGLLSIERLEKADATELRQYLFEESNRTDIEPRYRNIILRLIETLDDYIAGRINLMPEIHVNVSNVV